MEIAIVTPHQLEHLHHLHPEEAITKSKANKTFSLESYLHFLHSRELRNLTVYHLNKIVSIHGFRKLNRKKQAEEAVRSITELIHPARSTLNSNISHSSLSGITLTEAIKDLKALNWQECSTSTIRIISSMNYCSSVDIGPTAAANKSMTVKAKKKRAGSPVPLATSMTADGSSPSKSGSGCCLSSSEMFTGFDGVAKKARSKRVYVGKLQYSAHAVTALAATGSSS